MKIISGIKLEGIKEFCCGSEFTLEFRKVICGQLINIAERALCDKCFEKGISKSPDYFRRKGLVEVNLINIPTTNQKKRDKTNN